MSTVKTNKLVHSSGSEVTEVDIPSLDQRMAKAWVQFGGAAQTVLASYNISSVTDTGLGRGNVNFATAMPDTNYAVASHTEDGSGFNDDPVITREATQSRTTTQFGYNTFMNANANDVIDASLIFFR